MAYTHEGLFTEYLSLGDVNREADLQQLMISQLISDLNDSETIF